MDGILYIVVESSTFTVLKYNFDILVLKYFHFMLRYTSTLLNFRGKCCTFFTQIATFSYLKTLDMMICSTILLLCTEVFKVSQIASTLMNCNIKILKLQKNQII